MSESAGGNDPYRAYDEKPKDKCSPLTLAPSDSGRNSDYNKQDAYYE
jgi:hypothetical protein